MKVNNTQTLAKAVGLLGGTFDPIHFGHLRMAIEIFQAFSLNEVKLIPCYRPVHRSQPVAPVKDRFNMVKLAVKTEPALTVSDVEIKQQSPSYTIKTITTLRQQLPTTPLCFILGIDAFLGFSSWQQWQDILRQCHLIVAHRPQYRLPEQGMTADIVAEYSQTDFTAIHQVLGGYLFFYPITPLEISATDIRQQIVEGRNPRYLLPNSVLDYIQQRHIYQETL